MLETLIFFGLPIMFLLVTYNVGYKSSKTIDSRVTTKFEIGGAAKALELGGSVEVSIGYSNTEENSTSTTLRDITPLDPTEIFGSVNVWFTLIHTKRKMLLGFGILNSLSTVICAKDAHQAHDGAPSLIYDSFIFEN